MLGAAGPVIMHDFNDGVLACGGRLSGPADDVILSTSGDDADSVAPGGSDGDDIMSSPSDPLSPIIGAGDRNDRID